MIPRHPLARDVPKPSRRKFSRPWRTTARRCDSCRKEPPACTCPKEKP